MGGRPVTGRISRNSPESCPYVVFRRRHPQSGAVMAALGCVVSLPVRVRLVGVTVRGASRRLHPAQIVSVPEVVPLVGVLLGRGFHPQVGYSRRATTVRSVRGRTKQRC